MLDLDAFLTALYTMVDERVMEVHRQGRGLRLIARELGMGRETVRRFVKAGEFPERAVRATLKTSLTCALRLSPRCRCSGPKSTSTSRRGGPALSPVTPKEGRAQTTLPTVGLVRSPVLSKQSSSSPPASYLPGRSKAACGYASLSSSATCSPLRRAHDVATGSGIARCGCKSRTPPCPEWSPRPASPSRASAAATALASHYPKGGCWFADSCPESP